MSNRKASDRDRELLDRLQRADIDATTEDARTLRRAELTLQRWAERECGDGYGCISRDETTGKPYWEIAHTSRKHPIADLEAGALARVATVCKRLGLHYYHQTDPRGCALYVSRKPLTDSRYSGDGIPCCVE